MHRRMAQETPVLMGEAAKALFVDFLRSLRSCTAVPPPNTNIEEDPIGHAACACAMHASIPAPGPDSCCADGTAPGASYDGGLDLFVILFVPRPLLTAVNKYTSDNLRAGHVQPCSPEEGSAISAPQCSHSTSVSSPPLIETTVTELDFELPRRGVGVRALAGGQCPCRRRTRVPRA
jgi:hypothetical protein